MKNLLGLEESVKNWYITVKLVLDQLSFAPSIQGEGFSLQKSEIGMKGGLNGYVFG